MNKLTDDCVKNTVECYRVLGTEAKVAAKLMISQSAVNKRLEIAKVRGLMAPEEKHKPKAPEPKAPEPKLGGTDEDRRIISLQDECARLGKALKQAHRDASVAEAIKEVCGTIAEEPVREVEWLATPEPSSARGASPEVPVLLIGDAHYGETVEGAEVDNFNTYNREVARERLFRTFDKFEKLCSKHHTGNYPGAVIVLGGDFVSGGLHPELQKTDGDDVIPCALEVRDILVEGLRRMADKFGNVYVPAVAGNHGRNTVRPEFKRYYRKNYDWLIYQMLIREFKDDSRIRIDDRPSNDVYFKVYNERYLTAHGDMLGVKGGDGIIGSIGPITRGQVKQQGQSSALGRPFDKLVIFHWHQRLFLPRVIVNNALKGFDEFAMKALGAVPDRATQTMWFVHPSHGITAHWDIYVDDGPRPSKSWVSWSAST